MASHLPPPETADIPYYSSPSEVEADSLSDSDWLDISSKESDDNDSVSSDHDESDFGQLSRRSSLSIGSSRGEVEAWEGFAEDSGDEDVTVNVDSISPLDLPPALRNSTAFPRGANGDILEEQRVNAALDQSMMSTLSASRTSSGHATAAQNSVRDLRLSFPDPLTSSRDELRTLYEDSGPSEIVEDCSVDPIIPTSALDPGPEATPAVLRITVRQDGECSEDDLEVVMYGKPVDTRWSVVENVIKKAALGAGLTLTSVDEPSEHFPPLRIEGNVEVIAAFPKSISVIDRTSNESTHYQDEPRHSSKPSLAIIFLPARPSVPPTHTSYYPVFVPSDKDVSEAQIIRTRVNARNWVMRNIPHGSMFHVGDFPINYGDVSDLNASIVWNSLQGLKAEAKVALRPRVRKDAQINLRRVGITGSLLALVVMLLVRGYVTGKSQATPRDQFYNRGAQLANRTVIPVTSNTTPIPSSLKDYALSVFNPAPLVSFTPTPLSSPGASSSKLPSVAPEKPEVTPAKISEKDLDSDGKLMTWSERIKSSTDLILPGPSSLSLQERSKEVLFMLTPKSKRAAEKAPEHTPEKTTTSLSIRLTDSLSQIFHVKALTEVVPHDMKELSDALDQLMIVIGKQTTAIMKESKGSSNILRERLEKRNRRAKSRAKQLKQMGGDLGGQLISYVEAEIKTRAAQAKLRARSLTENFALSPVWKEHQKRVDVHRKAMEKRGAEKTARRVKKQNKRSFSKA